MLKSVTYKVKVEFPLGSRMKEEEVEVTLPTDEFPDEFIADYAKIKLHLKKWTGVSQNKMNVTEIRRIEDV